MSSWMSARLGQVHTSPELNANIARPSSALSNSASSAAMMSLKKMFGDLPPSSSVAGMRFLAAAAAIMRPTAVLPVNAILAMRVDAASAAPASAPYPFTMLSTPGGSRSPMRPMSTKMLTGVVSAGLSTTALPAARAGASFHAAIKI